MLASLPSRLLHIHPPPLLVLLWEERGLVIVPEGEEVSEKAALWERCLPQGKGQVDRSVSRNSGELRGLGTQGSLALEISSGRGISDLLNGHPCPTQR